MSTAGCKIDFPVYAQTKTGRGLHPARIKSYSVSLT